MTALLKLFAGRVPHLFQEPDAQIAQPGGLLAHTQLLSLEVGVVEAVEEEVQKIGNDSLCSLAFQQIHQIVVGCGQKFDEDLADDADPGLLLTGDGQAVKVFDDLPAELLELSVGNAWALSGT